MRAEGFSDPATAGAPPPPNPEPAAGEDAFHRVFEASPMCVRMTLEQVHHHFSPRLTEQDCGSLEILLGEVLNNIAEHGYPPPVAAGDIRLSITLSSGMLNCEIVDSGCEVPGRVLALVGDEDGRPCPDDLPEGGFGWYLIHDLTEEVTYKREGGVNTLHLTMQVQPS